MKRSFAPFALLASSCSHSLRCGSRLRSPPLVPGRLCRRRHRSSTSHPARAAPKRPCLPGGCFWGVQGVVFQQVVGVQSAVSGGRRWQRGTASYESVGTGRTGHAEAVRIVFDPATISYGELLQIYILGGARPHATRPPGPGSWPAIRSTVFATNDEQARVASAYIEQLTKADAFGKALGDFTWRRAAASTLPRPITTTTYAESRGTLTSWCTTGPSWISSSSSSQRYRDKPVLALENGNGGAK